MMTDWFDDIARRRCARATERLHWRTATLTVACVAFLGWGCGDVQPAADPAGDAVGDTAATAAGDATSGEPTDAFRAPLALGGRLERSDDGFRFFACDNQAEGRMVEISPDPSAMFAEIGTDGALTVVVRIVGERITDIRYAGPSEVNCNRFPPDAIVEAWGNEPFWNLAVQQEITLFRTPEQQAGVRYTDGVWTGAGSNWVYDATLAPPAAGTADSQPAAAATRVRLELIETECRDGMSGARFPYRAVLIRDSERLEGCALEGRQAMR
jgi:uncharacterized membrane protein